MNHKAIYALYPNVTQIHDQKGAFDADGNKVEIDMDAVNAWVDPDAYKFSRASEYPAIGDQLDMLYHDKVNGTSTWQDAIQAVKDKYPKS